MIKQKQYTTDLKDEEWAMLAPYLQRLMPPKRCRSQIFMQHPATVFKVFGQQDCKLKHVFKVVVGHLAWLSPFKSHFEEN